MTAQLGGLVLFLVSAGLFLAVGHQVTAPRQLQRLTWVFVATGAFAVVSSMVSVFEVSVGPLAITNASSIGSAFWTWLVALSLGQALFNRALPVPARAALAAVARAGPGQGAACRVQLGIRLAAAACRRGRPPAVPVSRGSRWRQASLGLTPALLYAGPAVQAWMAGEAYSSTTRLAALRIMWQVIQHNPWLGFRARELLPLHAAVSHPRLVGAVQLPQQLRRSRRPDRRHRPAAVRRGWLSRSGGSR